VDPVCIQQLLYAATIGIGIDTGIGTGYALR